MTQILPVILSGGSGTRLWPTSRSMYPKQLQALASDATMLQATALRVADLPGVADSCLVICNESHRFSVAEQLHEIDRPAQIILEPEGRNTAPAIALAAFDALSNHGDCLLLVMPADHVIEDASAFARAAGIAVKAADEGHMVTFGIVPKKPETGYGYIKAGAIDGQAAPVQAFVEKPDLATAESYVKSGDYFWNSGMFLFRASTYLAELERCAPGIHAACRASMEEAAEDGEFLRPGEEAFRACPSNSIDYAVMEKSDNVYMVPLDAGWSDVGSWSALQDVSSKDDDQNHVRGDTLLHNCSGTFVQAESRLVAGVGLKDLIVVETKDSVLVANRNDVQDVKNVVDELRERGRSETELHREVFRPWGSFDSLEVAENFQVKRLVIKPGAVLSLQKHAHRSEHWVVVSGKIRVTRNDEEFDLSENESTYVAIGDVHRIANPFDVAAHVIEVQCGDYLGEDDIVRLEDNYGRKGTTL